MKRVAVIGATSLLGQHLAREAVRRGKEVLGTFKGSPLSSPGFDTAPLDIVEVDQVNDFIDGHRPETVFLTSALTSTEYCESHPKEAWEINAEGTLNVAQACKRTGSHLIYVSSDYVFGGGKGEPYFEFDTPDPLSIYASTKLEGERLTLDSSHENLVCRVSMLYGWNEVEERLNFVTWVIRSLEAGKEVRLLTDQRTSPT